MASAPPRLKLLKWDKKSINEQELSKGGLCKKGVSPSRVGTVPAKSTYWPRTFAEQVLDIALLVWYNFGSDFN